MSHSNHLRRAAAALPILTVAALSFPAQAAPTPHTEPQTETTEPNASPVFRAPALTILDRAATDLASALTITAPPLTLHLGGAAARPAAKKAQAITETVIEETVIEEQDPLPPMPVIITKHVPKAAPKEAPAPLEFTAIPAESPVIEDSAPVVIAPIPARVPAVQKPRIVQQLSTNEAAAGFALPSFAVAAQTPTAPPLPPSPSTPVLRPAPGVTTPDLPDAGQPASANQGATRPEVSSDTPAPRPVRRFRLGPEIGFFFPTAGKTRDSFGSTWVNYGLGVGPEGAAAAKGKLSLDIKAFTQSRGNNRVFIGALGAAYKQSLSQQIQTARSVIPFAGATADVYVADARILRDGHGNPLAPGDQVHSGFRAGVGGSLLAGVTFGDTAAVTVSYQLVSQIKGIDYSGASVSVGFRF